MSITTEKKETLKQILLLQFSLLDEEKQKIALKKIKTLIDPQE